MSFESTILVEFFLVQLVEVVQSRSGLRRSYIQYKVGLCMIKHREVKVYIAHLFHCRALY